MHRPRPSYTRGRDLSDSQLSEKFLVESITQALVSYSSETAMVKQTLSWSIGQVSEFVLTTNRGQKMDCIT